MFAMLTVVEMAADSCDRAVRMLREELIPGVRSAPGFVRGTWFGDGSSVGHGLVLFEQREQAEQRLSRPSPRS